MRRLTVFNHVTLDGYIADPSGDMSWAHRSDTESREFAEANASGKGMLVFGRVTYDLMASFWPTPMAAESFPLVAERMNVRPKLVFSRTLQKPTWRNTRVSRDDPAAEIRRLKQEDGEDMAVLGSGSLVAQLAAAGLVDEYQVVINPVAIGAGKTMFEGLQTRLTLKLVRTRVFGNGNVLLCYEPVV